jgi:hypothetical protein
MAYDIDRATVQSIIDLDDAAKAAEARSAAARGGPAACVLSADDPDILPTPLTPEERLLHDRLGELSDPVMAQVLALYWLGRQASQAEEVDEETYRRHLAHAESNLDHTPSYLTAKPDLGEALKTAMAILGV